MHEMSIAQSVLEAAEETLSRHPGCRLAKVGLRIGALAGVDRDSLAFCFECLTRDTAHETARLEIDWKGVRRKCLGCGREFEAVNWEVECPSCGGVETKLASGDELDVAYFELEEPE